MAKDTPSEDRVRKKLVECDGISYYAAVLNKFSSMESLLTSMAEDDFELVNFNFHEGKVYCMFKKLENNALEDIKSQINSSVVEDTDDTWIS